MGDRTYVHLSVLSAQKAAVDNIITDGYETINDYGKYLQYVYPEVNYGVLDFLDVLRAAGIAYDSEWEAGNEYGAGCQSCRFTAEGGVIVKDVYDSELGVPIGLLMEKVDDPAALRELVLEWRQRTLILPWENQEEYGKLYRAHMLIAT